MTAVLQALLRRAASRASPSSAERGGRAAALVFAVGLLLLGFTLASLLSSSSGEAAVLRALGRDIVVLGGVDVVERVRIPSSSATISSSFDMVLLSSLGPLLGGLGLLGSVLLGVLGVLGLGLVVVVLAVSVVPADEVEASLPARYAPVIFFVELPVFSVEGIKRLSLQDFSRLALAELLAASRSRALILAIIAFASADRV